MSVDPPALVKQGYRMRRIPEPRWRAVRTDGYSPCAGHSHGSIGEAWDHAVEMLAAGLAVEEVGDDDHGQR